MEKKNKGDDETNEDAIADADESTEVGGAKEPNHSKYIMHVSVIRY